MTDRAHLYWTVAVIDLGLMALAAFVCWVTSSAWGLLALVPVSYVSTKIEKPISPSL